MKKKLLPVLVALGLIVVVLAVSLMTGIYEKYAMSDKKADLYEYFSLTDNEQVGIIMQNELIENKGLLDQGVYYVDYNTVTSYLNDRFFWDQDGKLLIYTTPTDIIKIPMDSADYTVSQTPTSESYVIAKEKNDTLYIAIDFVKKYSAIDYQTFESPNRMRIQNEWGTSNIATIKKDNNVRYRGGVKSDILTEVKKGETVEILEQMEDWSKVRTGNAFIGYIQNKILTDKREETKKSEFVEPVYTNISKDYEINMSWHQITNMSANNTLQQVMANTSGINTISPTWFSVADNAGNITSLASNTYVQQAHSLGMEVWGLVDNFNKEVDMKQVMSNTASRENLVSLLINAALQNDLDGINVDFEQLSEDAGPAFLEFIRELSVYCRANQIVLSIDNYVPQAYSMHYDRKEQGIVADYVIIMGYDEHYAGSTESGSVASINFVKEGIEKTVSEVPAEKVINAIPFYTRIWAEQPKTEAEIAQEDPNSEYVPYKLSSKAVGMEEAKAFLTQNGIALNWDATTGQNYGEGVINGITYKIWVEDASSIEEKLKVMDEYKLAGVAEWKLGFETPDIWQVISQHINNQ